MFAADSITTANISDTLTSSPSTKASADCRTIKWKQTFYPGHLVMAKKAELGVRFWRNLFAVHSMFTCDADDRQCRCKSFFCVDQWYSGYEGLAEEITAWMKELEELFANYDPSSSSSDPPHLLDDSERFFELLGEYHKANSAVVEWQAHHAFNEQVAIANRLCRSCRATSEGCEDELWSCFIGGLKPPPDDLRR